MPNKCNCGGCFIAVDSNWDLNDNWGERQLRRSRSCQNHQNDRDACSRTNSARESCECAERQGNTCAAGCQCDACARRASAAAENCQRQARNRSCQNCHNDCNDGEYTVQTARETCQKQGWNEHVGMINIEVQQIDRLYQEDSALKAGTLFPELHKPLNGYYPCGENCADKAQEAAFTAWELRLYLNTHPCDREALKLFRSLCKDAEADSYATAFLDDDLSAWRWVESPWPWEYEANCCKRAK